MCVCVVCVCVCGVCVRVWCVCVCVPKFEWLLLYFMLTLVSQRWVYAASIYIYIYTCIHSFIHLFRISSPGEHLNYVYIATPLSVLKKKPKMVLLQKEKRKKEWSYRLKTLAHTLSLSLFLQGDVLSTCMWPIPPTVFMSGQKKNKLYHNKPFNLLSIGCYA